LQRFIEFAMENSPQRARLERERAEIEDQLRNIEARRAHLAFLRESATSDEERAQIDEEIGRLGLGYARGFHRSFDTIQMELGRIGNAVRTELPDLLAFLHDRLKVHLRDQGIRHDVIDACLAMPGSDDLVLLVRRAEALAAFLKTEDGTNLLQGFKRAANILAQAEQKDGVEYSYGADPKWAESDEERALFVALDAAEPRIRDAMAHEDFPAAMAQLASLRTPIDAFFEAVQVNSDNQVIRRNRLNLLNRIRRLCLEVADLTRLEG
jgi:glycyl-tRNA synthetase beta subunit